MPADVRFHMPCSCMQLHMACVRKVHLPHAIAACTSAASNQCPFHMQAISKTKSERQLFRLSTKKSLQKERKLAKKEAQRLQELC
jgi:hypothetical protein